MEYAIELKELTKRFNQFTANDKISFQYRKGRSMRWQEKTERVTVL